MKPKDRKALAAVAERLREIGRDILSDGSILDSRAQEYLERLNAEAAALDALLQGTP